MNPEDRDFMMKMAEFVARNGPEFEEMMRAKQKFNPKFAFLFNGDKYHGYYRARVAELKAATAAAVKAHKNAGEAAIHVAHFKAQLLRRVLEGASAANIKEVTTWALEQHFSKAGFF